MKAVTEVVLMMDAPRLRWGTANLMVSREQSKWSHDVLCDSKHAKDVAPVGTLHVVKLASISHSPALTTRTHVDFLILFSHNLLARVVDKDVETSILINVSLNCLFAVCFVHNVKSHEQALAAVLFDRAFNVLRTDGQYRHSLMITHSTSSSGR